MTSHTTDLSGLIIPQTFTTRPYFKRGSNPVEVSEITHAGEVKDVNHSVSLLAGKARLPQRPSWNAEQTPAPVVSAWIV